MSTISKKLGVNIRRIRLEKGFNQRDFCKRLWLDAAYLSNVENGNMNPILATLEHIAKALGVTLDKLVKQSLLPADPCCPAVGAFWASAINPNVNRRSSSAVFQ
ncbi:MAG: hypothetical protein COV10_04345 [Candidatus Vogelbacteria bacterium CG10_big_fil_rev_8_21_14_0_10_51_16]|uniref:HTH cro/C1-type domain-containing protein n=1 Tax=Candidatus Vogelbacteria bacterium CG10_big_fil_rev_8_21_14_0_10_51_16 TaxID=1975045 RepID=A0A2H0RDG9_9BACT|nr:MAG: hypothetical protein COV10_04345 [Candidatus Vogelbacteria bacterium CG10_big_fil_rev_8_21_14_0_10_51_16]